MLIKPDPSPEPRQLAEHRTVETRANLALVAAGGAIVVALLGWRAAERQADIAAESLRLARDSIKASESAFFAPSFSWSPVEGYVDIGFQNSGKAVARKFSATLVVAKKTIPEFSGVGEAQTIHIERGQLPPIKPSAGQTVALTDYSADDRDRIAKMTEVISVEGSFQYDNGFGDVIKESICQYYVELRNSSGFMPCEDARGAITLSVRR